MTIVDRISILRRLCVGDIADLPNGAGAVLEAAVRVAASLCFVGHGMRGILTNAEWIPLFTLLGIPEWIAWPAMPVLGTLDLTLGLLFFFHPCRALTAWMGVWALVLALLRLVAGTGLWDLLLRAGTFATPGAYLLLSLESRVGWFDKIEAPRLGKAGWLRLRWLLQGILAAGLVGDGALAVVEGKRPWSDAWATLGWGIDTALVQGLGGFEIVLGSTALLLVNRAFALGLFYWAVVTQTAVLAGGWVLGLCQVLQQAALLALPMALLAALSSHPEPGGEMVEPEGPSLAVVTGVEHALRVGFACFVFASSLSTAYAWLRVDARPREQEFEGFEQLVAVGQQYSGWVPSDLPTSAHSIREVHDLNTKAALATFLVSDPAQFLGYINHLHETATPVACAPEPVLLEAARDWSAPLRNDAAHLQRVGAERRVFAYDGDTGRVFTWTCVGTSNP